MAAEAKDPRTHGLIGAAMEVHQVLGCGFLEAVYREAYALELSARGIPFAKEVELPVVYKGVTLQTRYRPDFVCFDGIVVEAKALATSTSREEAQLLNYLKASGREVGLLLNFGARSLEWKRIVRSRNREQDAAHDPDAP